tara:strand:- start:2207 stop:2707 length:501 start_codon:yes stop_codon:yes gene_type:complete
VGIEVSLTPEECRICRLLGDLRRSNNRTAGVKDLLVAKEDPMERDVQGVAAEMAFAKYYNLYPPVDVHARSGGEDFVLNGRKIDVKQTKYPDGRLIVPPYKVEKDGGSDNYVLITGTMPNFVLQGHARKEDLCDPKNLVMLRSLVYALPIEELREMPEYERNSTRN